MKKILKFLSQLQLKVWIILAIVIIVVWQISTGWSQTGKLWNIVMTDIVHDRDSAIETLEQEVDLLNRDRDRVRKSLDEERRQRSIITAKNKLLEDKNAQLQGQLDNFTQPSDPDTLVRELQKRGYRVIRIRPREHAESPKK